MRAARRSLRAASPRLRRRRPARRRGRRWSHWPWSSLLWWGPSRGSAFAFVSTIARIAVLSFLVCLVLLVGREHVERVGARAAADPLKAGVIGLLAQLLFFPLLIITI